MMSVEQEVSARWQLAQAALNIFVARESQAQVRVMKEAQQEVPERLSVMLGDSEWELGELYELFYLRDAVGAYQLSEHLPGISDSLADREKSLQPWLKEVKSVAGIIRADEASIACQEAVLSEKVNVARLTQAIYTAEEHLEEILCF
jgi:hypothetical protein